MKTIIWPDLSRASGLSHRLGRKLFQRLAAEFSELTGYHFEAKFSDEAHYISIHGQKDDGYVRFLLQLQDAISYKDVQTGSYIRQEEAIRITDIFVSAQGQGIGSALVRHLLMRLREMGIGKVVLEAGSGQAVAFWHRFDFRIDPVHSPSPERPAMYLRLLEPAPPGRMRVRIHDKNRLYQEFLVE
ncbi:GNAT family N-acetyltransferase [Ectobacillus ponti]|uniref:GNAT family N-acetyltransferase n=1 Tax=Ectobacillus ponti TaxID=2961894 RepID=A0AA41XCJ7_9BACI|nr:GNAT family N-acetyltransferase [Ectobacillus ponti]MCP8970425.1 GNAT family N-acetyltransferase [Ectobacillus ponti]